MMVPAALPKEEETRAGPVLCLTMGGPHQVSCSSRPWPDADTWLWPFPGRRAVGQMNSYSVQTAPAVDWT